MVENEDINEIQTNSTNGNILNKLNDLQKLIKKESTLKKLCN